MYRGLFPTTKIQILDKKMILPIVAAEVSEFTTSQDILASKISYKNSTYTIGDVIILASTSLNVLTVGRCNVFVVCNDQCTVHCTVYEANRNRINIFEARSAIMSSLVDMEELPSKQVIAAAATKDKFTFLLSSRSVIYT